MTLRQKFEEWYEADAMPAESHWFKRDPQFDDLYELTFVQAAWSGFKAGYYKALNLPIMED